MGYLLLDVLKPQVRRLVISDARHKTIHRRVLERHSGDSLTVFFFFSYKMDSYLLGQVLLVHELGGFLDSLVDFLIPRLPGCQGAELMFHGDLESLDGQVAVDVILPSNGL